MIILKILYFYQSYSIAISQQQKKTCFTVFLLLFWYCTAQKTAWMASHDGQPHYVTTQPSAQAVSQVDPFKQYHNEWSIGLCSCCDDMGQCKLKRYAL